MRHTRIVATVGPASDSPPVLEALITAGVEVFRLNFSHGSHASHADTFRRIRAASSRVGRRVAVMQDLSGPKIRTGALADDTPLVLQEGEELALEAGAAPSSPGRITTPYTELVEAAQPGAKLLLDDGRIELRVTARRPNALTTVVVHGGLLGSHKGINAPGVALPPSAVTEKDALDLAFGLELGIDLAALSFVQTPDDVMRAREIVDRSGRAVPVIAKIERPQAVRDIDAILAVAQGVMVARGDLGLEMPLEQVPRAQKQIIRRARAFGQPAIVATQVLESMRTAPRPTRAEVSDAATAVDQGVDAIMLAGETAIGQFPVRAVQTLDAVIRDAEAVPCERIVPFVDPTGSPHGPALCEAAVTLASTGRADAIVAVTGEGRTARMLSALRPQAPIFAATRDPGLAGSLALWWGVQPFVTSRRNVDELRVELVKRGLIAASAVVVFVNVTTERDRADANFLYIRGG